MRCGAFILVLWLTSGLDAAKAPDVPTRAVRDDSGELVSVPKFPKDRGQVTIPLQWAGSVLVTDAVRVNGESVGLFIVDTGTQGSTVDTSVAETMNLLLWAAGLRNFGDI